MIFQIDSMLQPCCKPMGTLLGGFRAAKGSMTERTLSFLKAQVKVRWAGRRHDARSRPPRIAGSACALQLHASLAVAAS